MQHSEHHKPNGHRSSSVQVADESTTTEVLTAARTAAEYEEWIEQAISICEEAARGNLEPRLMGCTDASPTARLGRAINRMLDMTDAFVRESRAALEHASHQKFYRRVLLRGMLGTFRNASNVINTATDDMAKQSQEIQKAVAQRLKMADDFQESVQGVIQKVITSAGEMRVTSEALAGNAANSSDQVNAVAAASEQTSTNMRTVAAAVEELTSSVGEITRQVTEASQIAGQAVVDAKKTNEIVGDLSTASARIGHVAQVISKIAGTTNLLALNATIEAARAGDAGKGFAVVASEVKDLARQTANATEEISKEISAIQEKTGQAVKAISLISDTISRIDSISGTISASVSEQRIATNEISSNVQQAAMATQDVSQNIVGVTGAVQQTSEAADLLLHSTDSLTTEAQKLRTVAECFIETVKRG